MNTISNLMHLVSFIIGIVGCLILTYGVTVSFLHWIKTEKKMWNHKQTRNERESLRHQLAYYLLMSLEFLIAADIIKTIVQPSLQELAQLGGILAIRTVISVSLNWELRPFPEKKQTK